MYFVMMGVIVFQGACLIATYSTIKDLRHEGDELRIKLYRDKRFWWTQEELDAAREAAFRMGVLLDGVEKGEG
jgi:hypothetical protein